MIRLIGAIGLIAYGGYKLFKEIENEERDIPLEKEDKTKEREELFKEAKEIQKEIARLHEIYQVTTKLTHLGNLPKLDIDIEGVPLETKLKEQEAKLKIISDRLKELNK